MQEGREVAGYYNEVNGNWIDGITRLKLCESGNASYNTMLGDADIYKLSRAIERANGQCNQDKGCHWPVDANQVRGKAEDTWQSSLFRSAKPD